MSNTLAASAREAFLGGDLDWDANNVKVVLVDATYTFSAAHNFLDDVGAGTRIATSANLGTKTKANGFADSADVVFTALAGGDTIVGLWVYRDSGTEGTSELIAWYDTNAAAAAISVATNGGDVTVSPNASGWFRL